MPLLLNELETLSDDSDDDDFNLNIDLLGLKDDSSSDDEFINFFTDQSNVNINTSENVQNIPQQEKHRQEIKLGSRDWASKFHITLVALTAYCYY